jgi:hypothetical protein
MDKKPKHPGGRPTDYDPQYAVMVFKLCLLGATEKEIAAIFEVDVSTIANWKINHPKFLDAIKNGRKKADAEIADSLYHRALGYEHPSEEVFCNRDGEVTRVPVVKKYAPDPVSAIFWLKNRHSKEWRERQEIEINGKIDKIVEHLAATIINYVPIENRKVCAEKIKAAIDECR